MVTFPMLIKMPSAKSKYKLDSQLCHICMKLHLLICMESLDEDIGSLVQ